MMLKKTSSLNLIAYLRSHFITVTTYCIDNRVYGIYEEDDFSKQVKEQYRNDLSLHRFLNEFRDLKVSKIKQDNE